MKKLLLSLTLILSFTPFAQPTIEWQRSLGGSSPDRAESIQQTTDGGYIIAGWSASNDGDLLKFGCHFFESTSLKV